MDAEIPSPSRELAVDGSTTHALVTVPDDAIGRLCASLDSTTRARPDLIWLHTSGSLGGDVIRAAGVAGPVGSCHPLVSMTGTRADLLRLHDAYFAIEGDPKALDAARQLVDLVGGRATTLSPDAKQAYHCAATLASNGVYGVLAAANRLTAAAGIDSDELRAALARLASESAANAQAARLANVATGPVMRGDAGTVRGHLQLLRRENYQLRELYVGLSRQLLDLAETSETRPAALSAVAAVLEDLDD